MGWCQTLLPLLSNPLTYTALVLGGGGLGLLYRASSYTFLSRIMILSTLMRILGSAASIINLAWRANVFVLLAFATTFSKTINVLLNNDYTGWLDVASVAGNELYTKIGLSTGHLVDGVGYLAQFIGETTTGGACTTVGNTGLLVSALTSFWIAAAAYIFALRIYDWMYGKGMTRELEWPETMMVLVSVTLFSLLVGVVDGGLMTEASKNTSLLVENLRKL